MDMTRTALTGKTSEELQADEKEWDDQKDRFSSGRTELGGGTKRRKRKGTKGGKRRKKNGKRNSKRNSERNSKRNSKRKTKR